MNTNTRIYIANLGKYNEGYLVGKWVDLPIDEEELENVYCEIKVGHRNEDGEYTPYYEEDGIIYEEVAIHDYETEMVGLTIGEWDNICELSECVEECERLREWEYKTVCAIMEVEGCELGEAMDSSGEYNLMEGVHDEEDLGRYLFDAGCVDIPEWVVDYFDFEEYGRDNAWDGNFTEYGFLQKV